MATSAVRRKPARPRKSRPDAPQNLTTRVTDAIRQSIVDAEFELGEALSESSPAARLGVSRTPVRRRSNAAHQAIATAFGKGNLPEAEQLVDEHVLQMAIGFEALRRAESPT
jgi:DNA-binding GntR family transcriptional regulator